MALPCSTSLYYSLPWLYSLYITVLHSTMVLLASTSLYYRLLWLYSTLLHSITLYHGVIWIYFTLLHSTMPLLGSTSLYYSLPWLYLSLLHTTQGRSHQIWSSQVSGACVSAKQLGGSGGIVPQKFFLNLEAMRLLLRPFLDQNDASRRPDDRVLHAWSSTLSARCAI